MLLRLAYLSVTNVFALLRLLPSSDRDKDIEILALRHQITVLERQLGKTWPRFLRPVHVERLRQGERGAAADQPGTLRALAVGQKLSVPRTSSSPQRPQLEQAAAAAAIACSACSCTRTVRVPPGEGDCFQCAPGGTIREDEVADAGYRRNR